MKKCENENYVIFYFNYFMMFWTQWVDVHKHLKKMVTNKKFAFTKVTFTYNLACVAIKKWLRFRRVITVQLAHISHIFST